MPLFSLDPENSPSLPPEETTEESEAVSGDGQLDQEKESRLDEAVRRYRELKQSLSGMNRQRRLWLLKGGGIALLLGSIVLALSYWMKPTSNEGDFAVRYSDMIETPKLKHPELRRELMRIADEGGTSKILSKVQANPEDNVAATLAEELRLFDAESISNQLFTYIPNGRWSIDKTAIRELRPTLDLLEFAREQTRKTLDRPEAVFEVEYEKGRNGFYIDPKTIDSLWIYAWLEEFRIAEHLHAGRMSEALQGLEYLFRLTSLAAKEKDLVLRTHVAYLRENLFKIVQALVLREDFSRSNMNRLHRMVEEQLAAWHDPEAPWVGDRAVGIWVYEIARRGDLLRILNKEDIESFRKVGELSKVLTMANKNLNSDQLFYLNSMRVLMNQCNQPFYRRRETFQELEDFLQSHLGTADYPVIAGSLLLGHNVENIRRPQRIHALDRSLLEMWSLATAASLGKPITAANIDPVTGDRFVLKDRAEPEQPKRRLLSIIRPGDGHTVTVPAFSPQ